MSLSKLASSPARTQENQDSWIPGLPKWLLGFWSHRLTCIDSTHPHDMSLSKLASSPAHTQENQDSWIAKVSSGLLITPPYHPLPHSPTHPIDRISIIPSYRPGHERECEPKRRSGEWAKYFLGWILSTDIGTLGEWARRRILFIF